MNVIYSQEAIEQAWRSFVIGDQLNNFIRYEILESWLRCKSLGVSPYQKCVSKILDTQELNAKLVRDQRFLEVSRPAIEKLYCFVERSGFVVTLSDAEGYVLAVIGDKAVINSASRGNWIPGADWSEKSAGTNAIGTPLHLNKPFQIFGYEHYCICSHGWTGSGAPIHDSEGNVIGVVAMAGTFEKVHPHTLGMVVATSNAIEMQMAMKDAWDLCHRANRHKSIIIDSISEGLLVIDSKNVVTLVNKSAQEMLKMKDCELIGQDLTTIMNEKILTDAIENRTKITDCETELQLKYGRIRCMVTCRPIVTEKEGNETAIVLNEISRARKLAHKMIGAEARLTFSDIVGENIGFRSAVEMAKAASDTDSNVLLLGESGTGKDIFAQAIHNASDRNNDPFIPINCGAIPRELIASELFGYAEGAFTGAKKGGNPGKFELADGGSIFLDEIGEMPLQLQTVLLRVLEQRNFSRIGGREIVPVNVRMIAATNQDLEKQVTQGNFRQDLFYRLNVLSIKIIPLRERKDDLQILAELFLRRLNTKYQKNIKEITRDAWEMLLNYSWPGNIRELQNVLERAIALAKTCLITPDLLPIELTGSAPKKDFLKKGVSGLPSAWHEARVIKNLLDENNWNISKVSCQLGVARSTLYRKIAIYSLEHKQA